MKKYEPVRWQPYSKPLQDVAAIMEARRSDVECIQELYKFLYKSGVAVKDAKQNKDD